MSRIIPIRTDADHKAALERIHALMAAAPGTSEFDELEVLSDLVEAFEAKRFPIALPSPLEAIQFRMEQAGLKPKDLEPYIGSRGKVSDVLSGKQPLTLPMIRALNRDLGIPADVLLQDSRDQAARDQAANVEDGPHRSLDLTRFPINELIKRRWVEKVASAKSDIQSIVQSLIESAGGYKAVPVPLCRRNDAMRENAKTDTYTLLAWCLKVVSIARDEKLLGSFKPESVTPRYLKSLAQLSANPDGPARVKAELSRAGIHLVCVRHLPKTYLDGAALRNAETGAPIVALTLRYDRLDNFWFSLFHELSHIGRHFEDPSEAFVDDFSLRDLPSRREDPREAEADEWANEGLIPSDAWESSGLSSQASYAGIISFCQAMKIHPAIAAGRIRHETRNFRAFAPLLGAGEVRKQLGLVE